MMLKIVLVLLVVGFVLGAGYVRMAPNDPARWHLPITAQADETFAGGAVRVAPGSAEGFQRLADALDALPRTQLLAGSVAEGHATYITRSRLFGFPDFTTIELREGQIRAFARLRFGASDLGVNAARLDQVFAAAQL